MSTLEKPDTVSASGHANVKALAALILGAFALANVVVLVIFLALSVETLDDSGGLWLLLPFFGLTAGLIAAFLGSIGWIDVRRGVTDRRLFEAHYASTTTYLPYTALTECAVTAPAARSSFRTLMLRAGDQEFRQPCLDDPALAREALAARGVRYVHGGG